MSKVWFNLKFKKPIGGASPQTPFPVMRGVPSLVVISPPPSLNPGSTAGGRREREGRSEGGGEGGGRVREERGGE